MPPKKSSKSQSEGPTHKDIIRQIKAIVDRIPNEELTYDDGSKSTYAELVLDELTALCRDEPELQCCIDDVELKQLKDIASKRGIIIPDIDKLPISKMKSLLNQIEKLDIKGSGGEVSAAPVVKRDAVKGSSRRTHGSVAEKVEQFEGASK